MKTKNLSAGFLLSVAALLVTGSTPAQTKRAATAANAGKLISVFNPEVANRLAERLPLSPRLDTLDGKTLYMVDINWGGPEASLSIFEEIQAWFAKNRPAVKTVIKIKQGGYAADDPATWKEIGEKGHAAIVGVSG